LGLQRVNPDRPFILRVDASGYAVGAVLEQLENSDDMPSEADVKTRKTVPIAFMSRKLAEGQRKWVPREQETYAIICALEKWESWIGLQPILVLTDHQALEHWTKEVLNPPSGPVGRRARWHQILSRFDITVGYIPGKDNHLADVMSRWAYPASQASRDISRHGSAQDKLEMKEILLQEKKDEMQCPNYSENAAPLAHVLGGEPVSLCPISQGDKEGSSENPPRFTFARPSGGNIGGREAQTPPPPRSPVPAGGAVDPRINDQVPGPREAHSFEGAPFDPPSHMFGPDFGQDPGNHSENSQPPLPSNEEEEEEDGLEGGKVKVRIVRMKEKIFLIFRMSRNVIGGLFTKVVRSLQKCG
jgi:hypothetical protein